MTNESEQAILSKLSEIKEGMVRLNCTLEAVKGDADKYQQWLENIERELGGNENVKGLRTRVTEIETNQKCQVWYWRALVTGLIGSTLGWIASIFGDHK